MIMILVSIFGAVMSVFLGYGIYRVLTTDTDGAAERDDDKEK